MDFNDTPEEAAFRAEARAFLEKHLKPKGSAPASRDRVNMLEKAKAWQKTKAENKFAQITWPEEWGGRGGTAMQSVIWGQEESKFDAPTGPFAIGLGMCVPTVIAFGSDEHKKRYVQKALMGEEIWCQLFSEPSAGSDVAGLKTRAVKDGDEWVINGQKVWTSGAHYSDFGILLVRTDPKVPKHKGLTMFIVNMKQPGVEVRPIHQASGGREFNEVYFTDVRIPDSDRLGDVGAGWKVALVTLMNERLAVGGSPGPDWGEIMEYARSQGTLSDQAFREKLADWYVAAQGYKLTKFRTQTALSRGQTPGPENSIGKIITANHLQDICNSAIEMQDHYGIINESDRMPADAIFQQSFMWAPGLRIAGGTDEILKNIIAERVLGLPQDVRVDKDKPFDEMKSG
ncbi:MULTISPECIES: acyl-CoA dehydrogenase family protein [unclassified Hyphomonas]|jgi:alkylation response protein AidB-like acyl-CoA dehydrogenase|uniref:acyl-CoA dehydrogenase family protein n=1 Tax=unclassified Hyphomonas TaxID=2630699 RepID=UPI000458D7DD|nr:MULTISPECIES: acyl-CoA dehydrogenase family protein [unclassified Hyphomonas]KCZ48901.1 acyl-CoA dehydrogenase [Hyphomonas sp. CY54-11-8]RAN40348.1 acyl-CoA dehydrogenase [Hyphomonas sp. GM-8P]